MANFVPVTTIYFFQNTKVSLQNQPFFSSESEKLSWYLSHPHMTFENYSYQREVRQWIRVKASPMEMRKFDMMAFQNAGDLAGKWIFCRIIDVEFINPMTSQVYFETDSMQTFIEDITFEECWVEREMVEDDWNGSLPSFNNLMPEGIESGEYKKHLLDETFGDLLEGGSDIVVLSAYDMSAEPNYDIGKSGAFYYGLNKLRMDAGGLEGLLSLYESKGRLDGIAGVWCVPKGFSGDGSDPITKTVTLPADIDGYTPKNAKCFTGEFCTIELSNRQGDSSFMRPEYLFESGNTADFEIDGRFCAGAGGLCCKPLKYAGNQINMSDFGVYLPMDVQTCYVGNAFANWIGKNKAPLIVEGLRNAAGVAGGAAMLASGITTANPIAVGAGTKMLSGGMYNTLNSMTTLSQKSADPAAAHGQANGSAWGMATGNYGFSIYFTAPNAANIESVDNFFTVYGYRTCRAKKPNVDTRPFWNYVKCAPAIVSGPITSQDKQEIEAILNAGVTFWHVTKGAVIGDYQKDNRG